MKVFAAVAALLVLLSLSAAAKSENLYEKTWKSIVLYSELGEEKTGHCTMFAVRFDPMVYVGARHCFFDDEGNRMPLGKIDGLVPTIVASRGEVVAVAGGAKNRPMLTLGERPALGEFVTGLGFGGPYRFPFMYRGIVMGEGHLDSESRTFMGTQSNYVGGMSGGPVINEQGRVVSVIQCGGSYGGHNADFGCVSTYDETADFIRSLTVR